MTKIIVSFTQMAEVHLHQRGGGGDAQSFCWMTADPVTVRQGGHSSPSLKNKACVEETLKVSFGHEGAEWTLLVH